MALLFKLDCVGDKAITRIIHILNDCGLRVLVSFDSHHVWERTSLAPCPHHGNAGCDCQVTILLVYDEEKKPVTLLAHGQDGETWISLVTTLGQRPPVHLGKKITNALTPFLDEKLSP